MSDVVHSMPVTGNTEHTQPENREFYPALDGLRAVAFCMVFLQHYIHLPWGWTGVNIFFVLSGFLITGILFDTRDTPHRARNFYVRRTLRIFPLYYGIFLAFLLSTPYFHWQWNWAWLAWPLYLGNFLRFLSPRAAILGSRSNMVADAHLAGSRSWLPEVNFGHFWSLCVEEQFYLAWPWVVFWVRSRRALLWICGVTVVVAPFIRVAVQQIAPPWALAQELFYRVTPFQLDSLLLGGFIALLWRGDSSKDSGTQALLVRRKHMLKVAGIVAAIFAVASIVYLSRTINFSDRMWREHYPYPTWRLTWGLTFINFFAAAVILCCVRSRGWLARLLGLPPLRWLGRISYGAYVFHDIFRQLYVFIDVKLSVYSHFFIARQGLVMSILGFCFTLLIAWLSFRFFESPFLDLKERWTVRQTGES